MDYESTDRLYSGWVVTTVKGKTRFYLNSDAAETATGYLSHAQWFRWQDQAAVKAASANTEKAWAGFTWIPMLYAEASNL